MDKGKLCLVIPSLQAGGMERVMSELTWYFSYNGSIELHLILYDITREVFYSIPGSIELHSPSFQFNNKFRLIYTIRTLLFIRRTIRKIGPESILSFGEIWNSLVLIALFGLKYRVFISDRCTPEKKFSFFHTILRWALYPHAKGIIAQTEKAKENYRIKFRHQNIRVIGNPIREISNVNNTVKENIVLMVGRLIRSKNHDRLIELFLKIGMPDWKLIIVGYDHLQQNNFKRLQELIEQNHAESIVLLEGKQSNVESYYNRSKIFAFTSSSEGFPNAIGEAMSAGLPVVAFDCVAGPSEMIENGRNGFLIPVYDYEQFQSKLEMLMMQEDLRNLLGKNAREDIKKFSISTVGKQYLEFIL
jgi:GalNAc-alpha-(1->4)-GalNAc-alpha-(1->3)-diNAcBac-PP-undecaprenol alpha-1,4-N-acetyl-D-galactosaminyltransferase